MAKRTAVWVLFRAFDEQLEKAIRRIRNSLIAEKGGTHTTDNDVDGDTERDQEASRNGVHSSQVSHGSGPTKNQHGADDDVGSKTKNRTRPV